MKNKIECYKVCYVENGIDKSKQFLSINNISRNIYELGKIAFPSIEHSRFFAFTTLDSATAFARSRFILKGFGIKSKRQIKRCLMYGDFIEILDFWKRIKNHKNTKLYKLMDVPYGTIFLDSFTPTELINYEN